MVDRILAEKLGAIDKQGIEAIALMGSYSRGEAETYSDIDIVCLLPTGMNKRPGSIDIIEDKYVVTSYVTIDEVEKWFVDPKLATEYILGLQKAKPLFDPNGTLAKLKLRACQFEWTEKLQAKANKMVSQELVGWMEEVHKALQGLLSNDVGRMLNGLFGLTFGIFGVVRVYKGILLDGENSIYSKIVASYGPDSRFAQLSSKAFGVGPTESIQERVVAGLLLFDTVTDEVMELLEDKDKAAVTLAKREIHHELENLGCI